MDNKEKSCLIEKEQEFILEAYGKEKKDAFGAAFGQLKKKAYQEINGLIIHMEPKDVFILEDLEKSKTQQIVGYFKPKQIQNYYVKMKVVVTVKYIAD